MTELARQTASAAVAYAQSLLGHRRTDTGCPWTPYPGVDDCAYFQSHVLWGGDPGPIGWVDNFKQAANGQYHRGADGLQPGDVILFDWDGNGVGNHVEMCFQAPSGRSVRTIGANGSDTIAVAYRTRPLSYVLGYFRPAYGLMAHPAAVVVETTTASILTQLGDPMNCRIVHLDNGKGGYDAFIFNPENLRCAAISATEETFLRAIGVKLAAKGVQARAVLNAFERVQGKGAN